MHKKSILYIITKSVWGGAAKYVYDLATCLNSEEFNVFVAAGDHERLAQKIEEANIGYFEIKSFQRKVNFLKDILALLEVFRLLFKIKPDIVHVNSSKAGGLVGVAAWLYKLLTGHKIHLVFTAHGWALTEDRPEWQLASIKYLSKLTSIFYNKIICVSEHDKKLALDNKITSAHKLVTIYNGLDISNLSFISRQEAQQKLLQKNSSHMIGTIAEWTKNKGLVYLLEAVSKIRPKNKIELVLIGSGENPDEKKLANLINKYQLNNVTLHKSVDQAARYLRAFDIFVLPSIKEGLPYTILEAVSAEVPVIATAVGGIPEIIQDKKNGLLVPIKNSQVLAENIIYLLNNPHKAARLTKNSSNLILHQFSLSSMIKKTKDVYSDLSKPSLTF